MENDGEDGKGGRAGPGRAGLDRARRPGGRMDVDQVSEMHKAGKLGSWKLEMNRKSIKVQYFFVF